jgi:hypothetical protein
MQLRKKLGDLADRTRESGDWMSSFERQHALCLEPTASDHLISGSKPSEVVCAAITTFQRLSKLLATKRDECYEV